MQYVSPSIDNVDHIRAYCKRHAYIGPYLTYKLVNLVIYHEATLVTLAGTREYERHHISSSNDRRTSAQIPAEENGIDYSHKVPSREHHHF